MDQDVGHPGEIFLDFIADLLGEGMGEADGEFGIDFEVEVDVVAEAGFAGETLFDGEGAGDGQGGGADETHTAVRRHGVHEVKGGIAHEAEAEGDDDDADGEAAPVVGGGEGEGVGEGQADGEEGDGAGEDVDRIIPGIGDEGAGADAAAGAEFVDGEACFGEDGSDEGVDGPGGGCFVGPGEAAEGAPADEGASQCEGEADAESGEGFEAAVSVRVIVVRGAGGDPEAEQDDAGDKDIAGAFDSVGDDGHGAGEGSDGEFGGSEQTADSHADEGDALTEFFGGEHFCRLSRRQAGVKLT